MELRYFVVIAILAVAGALAFNRFYLSKRAPTGPSASGQTFPFGSIAPGQPGQSPAPSVNFSQTGNLVKQGGKFVLVYDQPGNPAATVNLVFTSSSVCDFEKGGFCDERLFGQGERVRVDGNREGDTVTVVGITRITPSPASSSY
jgi:hypothetical protein